MLACFKKQAALLIFAVLTVSGGNLKPQILTENNLTILLTDFDANPICGEHTSRK